MKHIKVYITESRTKDNRFAQASIRGIEDNTGESYSSSHPKLLQDIICHALSHVRSKDVQQRQDFPYSFPLKLSEKKNKEIVDNFAYKFSFKLR